MHIFTPAFEKALASLKGATVVGTTIALEFEEVVIVADVQIGASTFHGYYILNRDRLSGEITLTERPSSARFNPETGEWE